MEGNRHKARLHILGPGLDHHRTTHRQGGAEQRPVWYIQECRQTVGWYVNSLSDL